MRANAVKTKRAKFPALSCLREYLFPSGCGGCGNVLLGPEDARFGLCGECRGLFSEALGEEKRCGFCGIPLVSEKDFCLSCREKELGGTGIRDGKLEKMRALFPYMGRFRTALVSYKFEKSLALGNFFARCMPRALAGLGLETLEESAWVPVPPRPGKIKRQGWDQVDYLAALLEREWRRFSEKTFGAGKPGPEGANPLPARRCLKRLPSRSQKELNREERGSNLAGRILCAKPPPKTAILFDDVITTGATLRACAAALREGGAEKVYGICLFYD